MLNDLNDSSRLERALQQARAELEKVPPLRGDVQRRIAQAEIGHGRFMRRALAAASAAALIFGGYFLSRQPAHSPALRSEMSQPTSDMSLDVGGVELTEHIAAIMNNGVVVVIWSCQGAHLSRRDEEQAGQRGATGIRRGRYRLIYQRHDQLAGGRTLVCSVFFADPGVSLTCEPPMMEVRAEDDQIVALSAAPRLVSSNDLTAAIRDAGGAESFLHDVQLKTQP